VTTLDRPTAAPQEGPYELGYRAVASPTFAAGMASAAAIFSTSAAAPAFFPVVAEMKRPQDFKKSLAVCMAFILSSYLSFSLVVYRWSGQWITSPSLSSAGPGLEKAVFGVGLIGLIVSAALYIHVAAKYLFVRFLRNTRHLQSNTVVHWSLWFGCTFGLSIISFIIAAGIPIFNYIVSLSGSICLAPLSMMLPAILWLYDHPEHRKGTAGQKVIYALHVLQLTFSLFLIVGGTYGVVNQIILAYRTGQIARAFSCADNSVVVVSA
jgi:hypothetical protein